MAEKNTGKGVNRADFSLRSLKKEKSVLRGNRVGETINSSYTIDADIQRRLKMLAVERGVKMNQLFLEAITDLLDKYGG